MRQSKTTRQSSKRATPNGAARSASVFIFATLGFILASAAIIPLQGESIIGPWALMLLGAVLGGFFGYFVGPFFSGLFESGGSLRKSKDEYVLSDTDPVTGMSEPQSARPAV